MKFNFLLAIANVLSLAGQQNAGQPNTPPLLINGTRFVKPGEQTPFFFKGIVIQHMFVDDIDPLAKANLEKCRATAKKLQGMGANTALVYRLDPNESHKECMEEFNNNGIQVLIGLSPESNQYNSTYSPQVLQNITRTIDEFIHYPNTLGYMAWIENNQSFGDKFSHEIQYVIKKSVIRDIRTYIRKKYQPKILPLLGANMVYYKDDINKLKEYLMCGERVSQPDFLTIGTFSHCGEFSQSDIDALIPRDLTIPMIFSELGCSTPKRNFDSWKQMAEENKISDALSGGFAYELYGTGNNDYGLISASSSPNSTFADNLSKTWNSIKPDLKLTNIERKNYTCPSNFPIEIVDNDEGGLMRVPSLDVCNCVVTHSPCISTLDDPEKLSKQLTSLCNSDSSKCAQYLGPITGNFSQCSMMTRISFLASLNYNKDNSKCPTDMKPNPAYSMQNVTKYFDSATKCETLWTIKLPVLTYNTGDFYGSNQTEQGTSFGLGNSSNLSISLPSPILITIALLTLSFIQF
jgi:hypothetical protein